MPREVRASVFGDGYVEGLIRQAHGELSQQIVTRQTALSRANELVSALGAMQETAMPAAAEDDPF